MFLSGKIGETYPDPNPAKPLYSNEKLASEVQVNHPKQNMAHIESCSSTTMVITDRDVIEAPDTSRVQ